ncbi:hypothetical protein [Roseisolibacter agri]|uniref:Uncharacterized protein n=1 Tax=Roseisolibacter agri TaxID=2014610 RepID=A0AA37V2C9_9BACT|nr:hypothetical protein [Roseisolibacter agri]GLC25077.1 hypothetical protein rosag_15900 [Roseisolibacter agri]
MAAAEAGGPEGTPAPAAARRPHARKAVTKVEQPHGGALLSGGVEGNRGGTGRPKSEVRALALEGAERAIPVLIDIVEDAQLRKKKPAVVAIAGDKLLKYGLGTQKEITVDEVKGRVRKTIDAARELLPPEAYPGLFADFMARLNAIWR